jgi:ABC-type dipeptide/oligopeptide/nickel transport system ATPase component
MALLEVRHLSVSFHTRNGVTQAVRDVSFDVEQGRTLGIVGESGSGKSVCCYSLLGLIPMPPGRIDSGTAMFNGKDLLRLQGRSEARARAIELLAEVGIRDPASTIDAWPHQFSGGMRQRVMIATAMHGQT